jgi:hypothetical protein
LTPGLKCFAENNRAHGLKKDGIYFRYQQGDQIGRCCDHNFLRFLPIFGEKNGVLSKTNVMIKLLHNLALIGVKNGNFFAEFFFENI